MTECRLAQYSDHFNTTVERIIAPMPPIQLGLLLLLVRNCSSECHLFRFLFSTLFAALNQLIDYGELPVPLHVVQELPQIESYVYAGMRVVSQHQLRGVNR